MKRSLILGCAAALVLASLRDASVGAFAQVPSQSDIEQSAGLAARFVYAATTGQTYVVKAPGIYDLEVAGARGGRGPNSASFMGGTVRTAMHGATVRGELQLNAGAVLHIFVGADGGSTGTAPTGKGGGGGGGTFVVDDKGQPIAVAGGGGGTSNEGIPPDFNGSTYAKLPDYPDGYTGAHGAGTSHDSGGSGGGGAGFYANGDDGATRFTFGFGKALGGSSYANGFAGGRGAGGLDGGGGNGGYGGGGGGGDGFNTGGGGGGGGYAGGGGGAGSDSGAGGYSYTAGLIGGTVVDAGDHAAYVTIKLHV